MLSEKLQAHLLETDQAARRRLEQMLPALAREAGATEDLKASAPMKWGERAPVALKLRTDRADRRDGLMNTCKAQAEEIVLSELIYD